MKKRKDGRYQKNIYIGRDGNGKAMYKSVFGKTQAEVTRKANEIKLKISKGMDILSENMPFSELCENWLIYKKALLSSDKQYKSYKTNLKPFSVLGDVAISKLVKADFQCIINDYFARNPHTGKQTSKKTLRDYRMTARQVFDFAVENRILDYNPLTYVRIPKNAPVSERRALTEQEQRWVMEMPHRAQLPAMIMMLSGLRLSECLALQWYDIDLENAQISVHQKLVMTGTPHIVQGAKSKAGIRTVNIPHTLVDFLKNQKNHKQSDFVVLTTKGEFFSTTAWRELWDSYMADLNLKYGDFSEYERKPKSKFDPKGVPFVIERFTAHYLRHTFATNLFFCGQDLLYVQNQLGHAKPETTLNIYTHLVQTNQIKKINKIIDLNDYISAIAEPQKMMLV